MQPDTDSALRADIEAALREASDDDHFYGAWKRGGRMSGRAMAKAKASQRRAKRKRTKQATREDATGLIDPRQRHMIMRHGVDDPAKVERLASAMEREGGWVGPPAVRWGEDDLMTGVHRYAAAKRVGASVPVVELEDIFSASGVSFKDAWEAAGEPTSDDHDGLIEMFRQLPARTRERYGIDYQ